MSHGRIVAHGTAAEVMTPEVISEAFSLEALVIPDPLTQTPLVVPVPGGSHVVADVA